MRLPKDESMLFISSDKSSSVLLEAVARPALVLFELVL